MKKLMLMVFAVMILTGCATPYPVGSLYTDIDLAHPQITTATTEKYSKMGVAHCQSILAMFAQGDCTLKAAMKNGGITKVHHTEWHAKNILGIIGNYELRVYGE